MMGACDIDSGENANVSGLGTPASPWVVSEAFPAWSTSLPSPVFAAGITLGSSTISGRWRERRSAAGELLMDYTGVLTLSGATVTGAINLNIPNSRLATTVDFQTQMLYLDASGTVHVGAWTSGPGLGYLSLRRMPTGFLSATLPFTWANSDSIRWGVRGLRVAG